MEKKDMITKMEAVPIETGYSIYFETKNINGKTYEQRIELSEGEIVVWNCTCVYGSAFRFSKENQEQNKNCRHINECVDLLDYLGYLYSSEEKLKVSDDVPLKEGSLSSGDTG